VNEPVLLDDGIGNEHELPFGLEEREEVCLGKDDQR